MDINTIFCTMKEMVFPGMGALVIAFLITCIPGIADIGVTTSEKKNK